MSPELIELLKQRRRLIGQIASFSRLDGNPEKAAAYRAEHAVVKEKINALVASGAAK